MWGLTFKTKLNKIYEYLSFNVSPETNWRNGGQRGTHFRCYSDRYSYGHYCHIDYNCINSLSLRISKTRIKLMLISLNRLYFNKISMKSFSSLFCLVQNVKLEAKSIENYWLNDSLFVANILWKWANLSFHILIIIQIVFEVKQEDSPLRGLLSIFVCIPRDSMFRHDFKRLHKNFH